MRTAVLLLALLFLASPALPKEQTIPALQKKGTRKHVPPPPAPNPQPTPDVVPSPVVAAPAPSPTPSGHGLSLGQAALVALRNHPDIKVAQYLIQAAQAQVDIASDGWYPTVSGRSGFSYSEAQSAAAGGQNLIRPGFTRQYSTSVGVTQTLLDFGRTQNAVLQARHQVAAAEDTWNGAYQDLMLNVATDYFGLLSAQQNVTINLDVVRNSQAQLHQAQGFFEAGAKARIDVVTAESALATARVGLIQARNAEAKARVVLASIMGLTEPIVAPLAETRLVEPTWDVEEAVRVALDRRPDLAGLVDTARASRDAVNTAKAQYFPTISASYTYAWSDRLFLPQPYNWNVGLNLNVPILNEPALGGAVRAAEANLAAALGRVDSLRLQIHQDATQAWLDLREARERLVAAQAARASSEENYRLAAERYAVGVGSYLEVSAAQQQLVQARSAEVQGVFDTQTATVRLYRQTGTLGLDVLLAGPMPGPVRIPPAPGPRS